MTTDFITTQYEFSHGRKPRGIGYWAFFFNSAGDEPWFAEGALPYGEAKKLAKAEAERRNVQRVYVAP